MYSKKLWAVAAVLVIVTAGTVQASVLTIAVGSPAEWDAFDTGNVTPTTWDGLTSYTGYFNVPIYARVSGTGGTALAARGLYNTAFDIRQLTGSVGIPAGQDFGDAGIPGDLGVSNTVYGEKDSGNPMSVGPTGGTIKALGSSNLPGTQNQAYSFLGAITGNNRKVGWVLGAEGNTLLGYQTWWKPVGPIMLAVDVNPLSTYYGSNTGDTIVGYATPPATNPISYFTEVVGEGVGEAVGPDPHVDPALVVQATDVIAAFDAANTYEGRETTWTHPAGPGIWWNPLATITLAAPLAPPGSPAPLAGPYEYEWTLTYGTSVFKKTVTGDTTISIGDLGWPAPPAPQGGWATISLMITDTSTLGYGVSGGSAPLFLPEPASMFVLAFGAVAALIRRRRR